MRRLLILAALAAALLPKPGWGGDCLSASCHTALGAFKYSHPPAAKGECAACHKRQLAEHPSRQGKTFTATAPPAELCGACHDDKRKRVLHAPFKKGECVRCHQPHGAAYPHLVAAATTAELCLKCHAPAPFKKKYRHGPVAEMACLACHDPHQSADKGLLRENSRALCLSCHDDFARGLKEAKLVHKPVREKSCTYCHDPHSSEFPYLLKTKMPDLCTECHKEVGKRISGAKVVHKPLLGGKGCSKCHSTHFSKAKGLMAGDQKAICLSCHGTDNLGTPPLRNVAKELMGDQILHAPMKNGKCDGCHDPHGSEYPKLLAGGYPDTFYAPYRVGSYDLCLKCHDPNLLRFPDTTIYTRFRNGNQNLHYLHVVDARKGRTCRACHETHAADGPKMISSAGAKFGQWRVATRFVPTATGGSCSPGCHKSYRYDRVKPVRYEESPEGEASR